MLKCLLFSGLACCVLFPALLAQQSPKTPSPPDYSKEGFVIESDSTKVTLENDGTQNRESNTRIRIQSEAGLQHYGLLTFPYQSATESVEIEYVRARKPDGSAVTTPPENVQDMAADITREAPFYSDLREKHIAVKGLSVGDVLEFHARWQITKPLIPGQFWFAYNFSHQMIILQDQLQVSVPRDRAIKWSSPDIKPVITEQGARREFTWTSSNLAAKTSSEEDAEQEKNAYQAARGLYPPAQIEISSFQSWEEVGRWYSSLQQERVQPSPEVRAKAAELTKNAPDDNAKMRAIYNYVSTQFRYIGVAFGIGRYQPHTAAAVLDNQYGDCKDKHTLLASLLQAVGIQAYPALISSSHKVDPDVPSPGPFDHVITVVPQGKDFLWLDATAEVGPFTYLVPPLRDKPALVMPAEKPALFVTTPADPPFPNSVSFKARGKLSDAGVLDSKMEETARGDVEVLLRSVFRRVPQSQWKELVQNISRGSGFGGTVTEIIASSPEATDSPFHYGYNYSRKDYSDWENRRITPPFGYLRLPVLKDDQTSFTQPVWLGSPGESTSEAVIEMPKGYTPELPASTNVVRDFAEYHSSCSLDHGVLTAKRTLVTKLREVPISEFEQYKSFRKQINDDSTQWIVLTSSGSDPSVNTPASPAQAVWNLPDSTNPDAMRAFNDARSDYARKDLQAATRSLERAVEADPKFTKARILLGNMQVSTGNERALSMFQKAVENDPQQPLALKMLAFAYGGAQRPDDAIKTWQALLKVNPEDTQASTVLGRLLISQKRYSEAVANYESALKSSPDDPFLLVALGTACLRGGMQQKGIDALQSALKLKPGAEMENDVGYELADANVNLPEALEHAQHAVRMKEEESQKVKLDDLKLDDLWYTPSLAAYWDTLGWVYFRLGRFTEAADYLSAAWELSQDSTNADHLGQVYEQQHQREAAIHMYRLSLAAAHPPTPETRDRLDRLAGNTAKSRRPSYGAEQELSEIRTVRLNRVVSGPATAEFFLLLSPGARVEDVKFISGSDKLKSAEKTLATVKFKSTFPQGSLARLLRRGILACYPQTGCSFVLFSPGSVRSVD